VGYDFGPDDHRVTQQWPECIGVWETVREFVQEEDEAVLAAIQIARRNRLPVLGCAPMSGGLDLSSYLSAGIRLDHESYGAAECLEKHCDVDQADSVKHIWQCLNDIGVERIDHGVNSLEDENLVKEINRRGLGLTVCPISNSYVTGELKGREIKAMLEQGMRVTVNSDDPAYFPGYMNENLTAVHAAADLTRDEIVQLARNAFTIAWLPERDQQRYLDAVERYGARGETAR
jgi:hypothetical protein